MTRECVRQLQDSADPRRWTALAMLSVAQFMLILDHTVVNVALPELGADLDLSRRALTWTVSACGLVFGGLLLLGGRVARASGSLAVPASRNGPWMDPRRWLPLGTATLRLLAGSNGGIGCQRQRHLDGGAHTAGLLTEMLHSRAVSLQPAAAPEHAVQPQADARHHNFADGFNTYTITSLYGNDRRRALTLLVADALAPVTGAAITLLVTIPQEILGLYLGFLAGVLLYLATSDILPEAHVRHPSRLTLACTVLGVGFMWLVIGLAS
jgi:MFS family permease